MTKDEIKSRISMALKDPVLQQGFEILCKENAELKETLIEAKEIIKNFSEFVNNEVEFDSEYPQEYTDLWTELCEKTEQFLSELKKMTEDDILKAKCNNCESAYRKYGKLCPWRSLSGDYCFDGMNTEEAHREIKKHFDDFQTKIARGLVGK